MGRDFKHVAWSLLLLRKWKWKSLSHVWFFATLWNSPGQNTRVGSLSLLQGIFPTHRSNPGLPHCRRILYQLSHKGRPRILDWVAYSFSSGSSDSGIELGSPALQADCLPTELWEKPITFTINVSNFYLLAWEDWNIFQRRWESPVSVTSLQLVPLCLNLKSSGDSSCKFLGTYFFYWIAFLTTGLGLCTLGMEVWMREEGKFIWN